MGAVGSLDGFIADDNDGVGPLFDWIANGDVAWNFPGSDGESRTTQASSPTGRRRTGRLRRQPLSPRVVAGLVPRGYACSVEGSARRIRSVTCSSPFTTNSSTPPSTFRRAAARAGSR
jgi:hypothetical protein